MLMIVWSRCKLHSALPIEFLSLHENEIVTAIIVSTVTAVVVRLSRVGHRDSTNYFLLYKHQ